MNLLCRMFGHQPPIERRNAGGEYGRLKNWGTDSIGRVHLLFYAECPRCEQEYHVGSAHLPVGFQETKS